MIVRQALPRTIENGSIHVRRIAIKRFCLYVVNVTLLLYLVPSSISEHSVPATSEYEIPGPVNPLSSFPTQCYHSVAITAAIALCSLLPVSESHAQAHTKGTPVPPFTLNP
jgi:hypothetical protein